MQETAKRIVAQRNRWKGLMANMWAHDMSERMRMRRKVIARDSGLGDTDVGTFPSEGATHTLIEKGVSPLTAMLMAGAMGVAGAGGYSLLNNNSVTSGDNSVTQPPKVSAPTLEPIDLEIEVIGGAEGPVIKGVVPINADQ